MLPRLIEVEPDTWVLLDQVIANNLDLLFTGMEITDAHLFRVTRNADLAIEEDEAGDLLLAIEEELRRRRFGEAVRLEVERSMPAATRRILLDGIGLGEEDCYDISGMLDLTGLCEIADLDRPDLQLPPWTPVVPPRLLPPDEDEPVDVFAAIRAGDILVHHPYESFAASVERFIAQAAEDPEVLTIKQTLYRTSGDSPIVRDLIRAAERGKQVVVLVEIKARFDEEANIVWARKLEQAGAHVVYGLVGPQDPLQGRPRRPPRGHGPPPLRPHRDRQLQPADGPRLRRPRAAHLPARARRRRDRPVQRPDRPVPPARLPAAARRAAQPAHADPRADRARDRVRPGRPRRRGSCSRSTRSSIRSRSRRSTGPARPASTST